MLRLPQTSTRADTPSPDTTPFRSHKTGRTTNYTTGRITAVNATVDVNYGGCRVARFRDQIITTPMSAGGDSGSLVADRENFAVGLLYADRKSTRLNSSH